MSSTPGAGSYRAVLTIRYAAATFGAALVGRLSYGLLPLALMFTVQHATRSFTTAGAVLAGYGLTSLLLPLKSRIVDRYGQFRVLPVLAAGSAGALAATAGLAWSGVHQAAVFLPLGALAGVFAPPLGPAMRATWRTLTEGTGQTARAYSLDSVCEEALYLAGPLLVGLILRAGSAPVALLATAALLLAGTLAMVGTPPSRHTGARADPRPPAGRFGVGPLRSAGFRSVVLTVLVAAVGTSVATTCIAARSQQHGMPAAAGYIEAALAAGSVLGGLAWGRLRHRRGPSAQLAGLAAVLAAGVALAAPAGDLVLLAAVMAVTGLAVAPLFVVAYLASDTLAPARHRTEASTWVNTGNNVGTAAGASLAGVLVDHVGVTAAFAAGAAVLAAAAVIARAGRRRIDAGSPDAGNADAGHTDAENAEPAGIP